MHVGFYQNFYQLVDDKNPCDEGGGDDVLFLFLFVHKGISIYQELENWRICKLRILNLIRI